MTDTKVYVQSTITGQVFARNELPQFMCGYEVVHRETFEKWCADNGFTPEEMGG